MISTSYQMSNQTSLAIGCNAGVVKGNESFPFSTNKSQNISLAKTKQEQCSTSLESFFKGMQLIDKRRIKLNSFLFIVGWVWKSGWTPTPYFYPILNKCYNHLFETWRHSVACPYLNFNVSLVREDGILYNNDFSSFVLMNYHRSNKE